VRALLHRPNSVPKTDNAEDCFGVQKDPLNQIENLGEHCKLRSGVQGGVPTANAFWTN